MVGGSCCKSIAKTSVTQTYCVTHYNHRPLGENVNSFSGWKKPLWSLADFGVRPQLIWNMPTFLHLQAAAEL